MLGEHNEEILTKELGYSAERVRELEGKGILRKRPGVATDAWKR